MLLLTSWINILMCVSESNANVLHPPMHARHHNMGLNNPYYPKNLDNVSSMKFNRLNIRKIAKVFVNLEKQKTNPKNKDSRYVDRQ